MSNVGSFSYKIIFNGTELDSSRMKCIESVVLNDKAHGSDLLQINIIDSDLKFAEDSILVEKAKVKFEATSVDSRGKTTKLSFDGYVAIIDLDFPGDGSPKMTLHCMDTTYLMDAKEKKRTWQNMKVSDVVSKVFQEYGLTPKVDATKDKVETISQSNTTDIAFLLSLADSEKEDYLCYVEGTTGYFVKKPKEPPSQKDLVYKDAPYDILGFSPRIAKKQNDAKEEDIDPNAQKDQDSKDTYRE